MKSIVITRPLERMPYLDLKVAIAKLWTPVLQVQRYTGISEHLFSVGVLLLLQILEIQKRDVQQTHL